MNSPKTFKAIIIDDFHPVLLEKLDQNNIQYHYLPEISREEALRSVGSYDIVIVRSKIEFTKELIESLPNLKCIARGGAGMDNIDEEAASVKGITLLNAPEGNRDAVAEHAIGLILSLSNKINIADREVRNRIWRREANRGFEIGGKTIGIIGFGNTGQALASKLSGFGCNLIAYDKYHPSSDNHVKAVELNELLEFSDIISLHIPLTKETKGMVDNNFLSLCGRKPIIINTSRGGIVNQLAVLQAFSDKKIRGFGSDVLENENFDSYSYQESELFDALSRIPEVIMTPHVAGWTAESYLKIAEVIGDKVTDFTTK